MGLPSVSFTLSLALSKLRTRCEMRRLLRKGLAQHAPFVRVHHEEAAKPHHESDLGEDRGHDHHGRLPAHGLHEGIAREQHQRHQDEQHPQTRRGLTFFLADHLFPPVLSK
jgi:hypothetical protein